VAVVSYAASSPFEFVQYKVSSAASLTAATTPTASSSPAFRWKWRHDNGSFDPYRDEISKMIEGAYEKARRNGPSHQRFETPPIVRYIDDKPAVYIIDFQKMQQINKATNFSRGIKRELESVLSPGPISWEYELSAGIWAPYDRLLQGHIEQGYVAYVNNNGPGVFSTSEVPERPETYVLDFIAWMQSNTVSSTSRRLRRVNQPSS